MQCSRGVILDELFNVRVDLVPTIGFRALDFKSIEPREGDVLDVLNARIAIDDLRECASCIISMAGETAARA